MGVIPVDAPKTIREKIVAKIMELIKAMEMEGEYAGTPLFNSVLRGDPDEITYNVLSAPFCFVEDGDENLIGNMTSNFVSKRMRIYIHVKFNAGQQGVDPHSVFNYYLGRLQSLLLRDNRLEGTCRDIDEVMSAPQVFRGDNLQGGYLVLDAVYAHLQNDPYTLR